MTSLGSPSFTMAARNGATSNQNGRATAKTTKQGDTSTAGKKARLETIAPDILQLILDEVTERKDIPNDTIKTRLKIDLLLFLSSLFFNFSICLGWSLAKDCTSNSNLATAQSNSPFKIITHTHTQLKLILINP